MLYRKVPKNGDQLSVLGYGCMRFPVRMQSINEKLAQKQILQAMDQGVNYFDTAAPYHNGKSEPFLGMEGIFTTPMVWLGKRAMKVKNR